MIELVLANNNSDLHGILSLQKANYKDNVSAQEATDQGFLSVIHTFETLLQMNQSHQHIVAKNGEIVIGYALCMLREFANHIPILVPMFDVINKQSYKGQDLKELEYMAMGQICIDRAYRGKGIFYGLYEKLKTNLKPHYSLCVTEVATKNKRSLRAHHKVGFELQERYISDLGESWDLVVWEW